MTRDIRSDSRPQHATGDLVDITGSGGVAPHEWWECMPAVLTLEPPPGQPPPKPDPAHDDQLKDAMLAVWLRLSDLDRQAFHRVCCLNSRTREDVAVVQHIAATLDAEMTRFQGG